MGQPINGFFIPWDYNLFTKGIADLMSKMGVAINIGFWIFIIVSGILLLVGIIRGVGK